MLTKDRVYLTGCIAESSKQHFGKWNLGADSITEWISCKGTWESTLWCNQFHVFCQEVCNAVVGSLLQGETYLFFVC